MNAVFSYNPENNRYGMEFDGAVYFFNYHSASNSCTTAWDADGKLIAKTYKGFRNKVGIQGGTGKAAAFLATIQQAKQYETNKA